MATKNPEDVKAELARKGVSISQWSVANGISVVIVYGLLAGRRRGYRGESHRAAVLLGLKEGEVIHPSEVKQAHAS